MASYPPLEVKVSKIAECGWGRDRLKFLYNCLFARGGAWSLACRGGKMPKNNYAAYKRREKEGGDHGRRRKICLEIELVEDFFLHPK